MPIHLFSRFVAGLWRRVPHSVKITLAAFAVMLSFLLGFLGFSLWRYRQELEAGRRTHLYRAALGRLLASPQVIKALGKPIREGDVMKVHGEWGIVFQMRGKKTSAEVLASGTGKERPFQLTYLEVRVYKGDDVVLVDSEDTPVQSPPTHQRNGKGK